MMKTHHTHVNVKIQNSTAVTVSVKMDAFSNLDQNSLSITTMLMLLSMIDMSEHKLLSPLPTRTPTALNFMNSESILANSNLFLVLR